MKKYIYIAFIYTYQKYLAIPYQVNYTSNCAFTRIEILYLHMGFNGILFYTISQYINEKPFVSKNKQQQQLYSTVSKENVTFRKM